MEVFVGNILNGGIEDYSMFFDKEYVIKNMEFKNLYVFC